MVAGLRLVKVAGSGSKKVMTGKPWVTVKPFANSMVLAPWRRRIVRVPSVAVELTAINARAVVGVRTSTAPNNPSPVFADEPTVMPSPKLAVTCPAIRVVSRTVKVTRAESPARPEDGEDSVI